MKWKKLKIVTMETDICVVPFVPIEQYSSSASVVTGLNFSLQPNEEGVVHRSSPCVYLVLLKLLYISNMTYTFSLLQKWLKRKYIIILCVNKSVWWQMRLFHPLWLIMFIDMYVKILLILCELMCLLLMLIFVLFLIVGVI